MFSENSLKPQKLLDPMLVKADNSLTIDQRHRRALVTQGKQLFQGRRVLAHVLVYEGDTFLRKKLFLSVARPSTGLGKDDDGFRHIVTSFREKSSPSSLSPLI